MAGKEHLLPIRPHNPESDQAIANEAVGAGGEASEAVQGDEDAGAQEGIEQREQGRLPARVHVPHHVSQAERDDHERIRRRDDDGAGTTKNSAKTIRNDPKRSKNASKTAQNES